MFGQSSSWSWIERFWSIFLLSFDDLSRVIKQPTIRNLKIYGSTSETLQKPIFDNPNQWTNPTANHRTNSNRVDGFLERSILRITSPIWQSTINFQSQRDKKCIPSFGFFTKVYCFICDFLPTSCVSINCFHLYFGSLIFVISAFFPKIVWSNEAMRKWIPTSKTMRLLLVIIVRVCMSIKIWQWNQWNIDSPNCYQCLELIIIQIL